MRLKSLKPLEGTAGHADIQPSDEGFKVWSTQCGIWVDDKQCFECVALRLLSELSDKRENFTVYPADLP
jgi:Zn-finger protein